MLQLFCTAFQNYNLFSKHFKTSLLQFSLLMLFINFHLALLTVKNTCDLKHIFAFSVAESGIWIIQKRWRTSTTFPNATSLTQHEQQQQQQQQQLERRNFWPGSKRGLPERAQRGSFATRGRRTRIWRSHFLQTTRSNVDQHNNNVNNDEQQQQQQQQRQQQLCQSTQSKCRCRRLTARQFNCDVRFEGNLQPNCHVLLTCLGGLISGTSQFSLLAQMPQKILHTTFVVSSDLK